MCIRDRHQREHVCLPGILHTDRPACGLRRAEINTRISGRIAAFLVENQVFGFEVDGILEFSGSALILSLIHISFDID